MVIAPPNKEVSYLLNLETQTNSTVKAMKQNIYTLVTEVRVVTELKKITVMKLVTVVSIVRLAISVISGESSESSNSSIIINQSDSI